MNKADIVTLFDYNYWANGRILNAAARVTAEQFAAVAGLNYGSLCGTLVHILGAEMVWRLRCQEEVVPRSLPQETEFPTFSALRARWQDEEAAMRGFLATLTDDLLRRTIRYTTTKGITFEHALWQPLIHVVNHGTQHRAEAAMLLTEYGCSPGDVDMILFLREEW